MSRYEECKKFCEEFEAKYMQEFKPNSCCSYSEVFKYHCSSSYVEGYDDGKKVATQRISDKFSYDESDDGR